MVTCLELWINTYFQAVQLLNSLSSDRYFRARVCKPLRSPGIHSEISIMLAFVAWLAGTTMGLSCPHARLHWLAELIPWNRFMGSKNIYKFRLSFWNCTTDEGFNRAGSRDGIWQEWIVLGLKRNFYKFGITYYNAIYKQRWWLSWELSLEKGLIGNRNDA